MVLAVTGRHPYLDFPAPPWTAWACSVNYKEMRDSVIPAFEGDGTHRRTLPRGIRLNEQKMEYRIPVGYGKYSIIRLKSADSGREAFQGASLPLIWLDEEMPEEIFKELFVRIGPGFKRRILWTMTAVGGLSYVYDYFYLPWQTHREQNPGVEHHPDIFYSQASMYDVPYLDREEIDKLAMAFPPGSKEWLIRRDGGFADLAGQSVFSDECIAYHRCNTSTAQHNIILSRSGIEITAQEVQADQVGHQSWTVQVWEAPQAGGDYVIGADVAEGRQSDPENPDSTRDYSVATVMDRQSLRVVAMIQCQIPPLPFGQVLWMMGHWYNQAWVVPEINSPGIAVLGVLIGDTEWPVYPRIYQRHTDYDEYTKGIVLDDLGWRTTTLTRGKMVEDLRVALDYGPLGEPCQLSVYDERIVVEMQAFQTNKLGKPEAIKGRHDDIIMAMACMVQGHQDCPSGRLLPMQAQSGYTPQIVQNPAWGYIGGTLQKPQNNRPRILQAGKR